MKSYKDVGHIPSEYADETLLDQVVELLGRFKKKSAIHAILQEDLPGITTLITSLLISRAKAKICQFSKEVDTTEIKSRILEFLMQMISGPAKNRDRLKAVEMLAEFSGVNQITGDGPEDTAKKIIEAVQQMDDSVPAIEEEEEEEEEESIEET